MFKNQNGSCGICQQVKPLVVDHCHASGKVRKLLCQRCNIVMGVVDDIDTLKKALRYKDEFK